MLQLVVDELALVTIGTLPRRVFVPLFAHFCLVVFVHRNGLHDQLMVAVRITAFVLELALTSVHEITA